MENFPNKEEIKVNKISQIDEDDAFFEAMRPIGEKRDTFGPLALTPAEYKKIGSSLPEEYSKYKDNETLFGQMTISELETFLDNRLHSIQYGSYDLKELSKKDFVLTLKLLKENNKLPEIYENFDMNLFNI